MIKGLVLFDYDGTLVDERDKIYVPTHRSKEAIALLQDAGYLCVLATGRALSYIPSGAKDLYLDGYVTSNGAYATMHGKEIHNDILSDDELTSLIQYMLEHDVNFVLEGNQFCYVKDLKEASFLHFMDNFKIPWGNFVQYKDVTQVRGKIAKITIACKNPAHLLQIKGYFLERYQCSFHRNCDTFDIGKKGIHKGVGVKAVIEHFDIPYENTYAFGDGDNDIELLDTVTYGIAMYQHDPRLDDVAYMITGTVKEEGIYQALKKMEVI